MGQITKDFAQRIVKRANSGRGRHSPLTVWEECQLAYAWLWWNHAIDTGMIRDGFDGIKLILEEVEAQRAGDDDGYATR